MFSIILLRVIKIEDSGKKSAFICFLFHFIGIIPPLATLLSGCNEVNLAGHTVPYGERYVSAEDFTCIRACIAVSVYSSHFYTLALTKKTADT